MAYFNVDLRPEIRAVLDSAAQDRLRKTRPITQYMWVTTTPEGRAVFNETALRPEWRRRPIDAVNAYVKEQYLKATGGLPKGRPQLAQMRAKIIEEALIQFLGIKE